MPDKESNYPAIVLTRIAKFCADIHADLVYSHTVGLSTQSHTGYDVTGCFCALFVEVTTFCHLFVPMTGREVKF